MFLSLAFCKCVEPNRRSTVVSCVHADSSQMSGLLYDYLKQEYKNSFICYFTALHYLHRLYRLGYVGLYAV
jgi:hypothetical protein